MELNELILHWGDDEIEHRSADPEFGSHDQANQVKNKDPGHDDEESANCPPQMDAQILEMITERHPRVGEHVFGIGLFFEFEHEIAKDYRAIFPVGGNSFVQ